MTEQTIRTQIRQQRLATQIVDDQTVVTEAAPESISSASRDRVTQIVMTGRPGPAGPAGEDGAPGAPGPSGSSYVHHQGIPATVWNINHNLGMVPNWFVLDSAGTVIAGFTVIPVDLNNTMLTFAHAFGGTAYGS